MEYRSTGYFEVPNGYFRSTRGYFMKYRSTGGTSNRERFAFEVPAVLRYFMKYPFVLKYRGYFGTSEVPAGTSEVPMGTSEVPKMGTSGTSNVGFQQKQGAGFEPRGS